MRHNLPPLSVLSRAALACAALAAAACANDVQDEGGIMNGGFLDDAPGSDIEQAMTSTCAGGPTVKGIDVSYYQGTIDWARVRGDGVRYAFIRVSDGTGFRDSKFDANWRGAKAHDVMRGAYQFFRADEDPIAQADLLISKVGGHLIPGDLPPVIDVESADGQSKATIARKVRTWLDRVESKLGVKPIVYTGPYFWRDQVGGADVDDHPLWVAHYGTNCPMVPPTWTRWTFHQFTSSGRTNGISGNVDTNHFNGTLEQLRALTVKSDRATRADAMFVLGRAAGMPLEGHPNAFRDDNGHPRERYMNAAKAWGVLLGNANREGNPDGTATRDQLATFLVRMYKLPAVSHDYFSDDNGDAQEDTHNKVAAVGLFTGFDDGHGGRKFKGDDAGKPDTLTTLATRAKNKHLVPVWDIPEVCLDDSFEGTFCDDDGTAAAAHHERLVDELGVDWSCRDLAGSPAFCPQRQATRADVMFVLGAAAAIPLAGHPDAFDDDDNNSHERYLNAGKAFGIMVGYAHRDVRPNSIATRNTLAVILSRMYALPATSVDFFSDDDGDANEAAHNRVGAAGLFSGYDDGHGGRAFGGARKATRTMLATVAVRAADQGLVPVWR